MRYLIAIIITFCFLKAKAQKDTTGLKVPVSNGKIIYQGVVESSLTQKELYKNAKQWIVDYFREYKAVIETEDIDQAHLSAKGVTIIKTYSFGIASKFYDKFTVQIDLKDKKFRYKIYDFTLEATVLSYGRTEKLDDCLLELTGQGSSPFSKGQDRELLKNNDQQVSKMVSSLKVAMQNNMDF